MKLVILTSLGVLMCSCAHAIALGTAILAEACPDAKSISKSYIGEDMNVLVEALQCSHPGSIVGITGETTLNTRQDPSNVCGQPCATNCFTPSGGGPNPNDCHVIADAILFESQNTGALFPIGPATNSSANVITMTFRSCETFIVNQSNSTLTYCRTAWSELVDYLSLNCQSTQNAHGGNCVAKDQRWFVQVQHS